jgi:hypothetical protein
METKEKYLYLVYKNDEQKDIGIDLGQLVWSLQSSKTPLGKNEDGS